MWHARANRKLGVTSGQRKALLRGIVSELIFHESIRVTLARAKEARSVADRIISIAHKAFKNGLGAVENADAADILAGKAKVLNARRQVLSLLPNETAVVKLFSDIASRFQREDGKYGGYTRILRIGPRKGDGAPMCLLELTAKLPKQKKEEPKK